jgi:(1->4)-alpha-D-glucan 1-alpha-D-glucosylmutase
MLNSLSQTLCKLAAPGMPDIYQGNETWDFSLVDPDNRRPVDYERRAAMLRELRGVSHGAVPRGAAFAVSFPRSLLDSLEDGRAKLYLISRVLEFRREHEALFREGEYLPARVSGAKASHVCAFVRRRNEQSALVIVPRLYLRLLGDRALHPLGAEVWGDTRIELPARIARAPLRNLLNDTTVQVSEHEGKAVVAVGAALMHFPVALLCAASEARPEA